MSEIEDHIYNEIEALSEEGNLLAEKGNYDSAIEKFKEAFSLVPDLKKEWETSTWLLTSIGDMYFFKNDFDSASKFFYDALNCPDGIENPFINLRLGQSLMELGQIQMSKEYLLRAYMIEGKEIFEEEDQKYFSLIEDLV
jgi:tetratricopeptide (TPR) repeat protein